MRRVPGRFARLAVATDAGTHLDALDDVMSVVPEWAMLVVIVMTTSSARWVEAG